jgi:hypothetical protein
MIAAMDVTADALLKWLLLLLRGVNKVSYIIPDKNLVNYFHTMHLFVDSVIHEHL